MFFYSRNSIVCFFAILFFLGLISSPIFLSFQKVSASVLPSSVTVSVTGPVCGNGLREGGEQCDGADLAGKNCLNFGYIGGTLSCKADCTFNTLACISGGGGGGGGGGGAPPVTTKVILQGKAYPGSSVTILQDGRVAIIAQADSLANFRADIANITSGIWSFTLWAEDKEKRKSANFSFTTNVPQGMTTSVTGIFLPPTIELEKANLQRGEILNILGMTAPESEISIHVYSAEIIKKTKAETDGTYLYLFDTTSLEDGSHSAKSKAVSADGLLSSFSQALAFNIGKEVAAFCSKKADINGDGKVNLVDFSILLYSWGKPKNLAADLNCDDKVNLTDFSIMLYYWTG